MCAPPPVEAGARFYCRRPPRRAASPPPRTRPRHPSRSRPPWQGATPDREGDVLMEGVEESGRTPQEAIEKALHRLGMDITQVHVTILSEGRTGILSFRGGQARVSVVPRAKRPSTASVQPANNGDDAATATEVLENLLRLMGVDAAVSVRAPETPGDGLGLVQGVLDVSGDDLGILIGRRGDTLASLHHLLNLMLSRKLKARTTFGVDVEGYRRRREESLKGLALLIADPLK